MLMQAYTWLKEALAAEEDAGMHCVLMNKQSAISSGSMTVMLALQPIHSS